MWVEFQSILNSRIFSGPPGFLPPQNQLPLYRATNLSEAFQLTVTCYPIQIKSSNQSISDETITGSDEGDDDSSTDSNHTESPILMDNICRKKNLIIIHRMHKWRLNDYSFI